MRKTFRYLLSLVVAMTLCVCASAQVTTSSISGKVTDAAGSVAGATITAVHTPSGSVYYSVADADGNYRILNILAGGPYTVTVSMLGYSDYSVTDVYTSLADNYRLDAQLKEESIGLDAIVITAEAANSNMKSDRAGAITALDRRQINSVPTVSRSLNDLLRQDPNTYVSGSYAYIGGGNYRQSFVTVDGAAFNNAFGIGSNLPGGGSPISLDALEQVSISVTPYDVRQSGFVGGGINATTRSGSNTVEGSAYVYFKNQDFIGTRIDDYELNLQDSRYLLYGARVGGPIIKDKLFFFVNVEVENSVEPGPSRVAATDANPYTDGSNNVARPKQAIMDQISQYLADKYDYKTGAYQGYSAKSPGFKLLGRLDWNINRNHKFNIRYSLSQSKYPSAPSTSTGGLGNGSFSANNRQAMTALYFENARYFTEQNFTSVAAELNSRFLDGRLNNTLRASWSQQNDPRSTEGKQFPFVDLVVEGNIYTSFGTELFSFGNLRYVNTLNLTDELSYVAGKHNLLAGVQLEHNNTRNGFQRMGAGYYEFDFATEQALVTALNEGTLFDNPAQFAITHSLNKDFSQAFPQFDFNQLSLYAQDEISASDRFKLTAGLRVDFPMYPQLNTFNNQVASTALEAYNGHSAYYDTSALPKTTVMFSPRVGFNWDVLGNRKLVVRGGTGIFTGRIPFVWIVSQAGDAGVLQTTATRVASKGQQVPAFTTDRVEMCKYLYGDSFNPENVQQTTITSCTVIDPELKMPQTWKSSFAVDVKLPWGIVGTVEGVYNKDLNGSIVRNIGLKGYDYTLNDIDNRPIWGERYDETLSSVYLLTNTEQNGWYYSVTGRLSKNFSKGFSAMVSYTHADARNVFDGSSDQPYSVWQYFYTAKGNNLPELSYANFVMPHRLMANVSWQKDYGRHWGSQISLFYNGGPQGRGNYYYTTNIVGDGATYNLIYVPKSQDELTFADYKYKDVDGNNVTYTADEQAADFWAYINQDKYLRTRKGMYAERNGVVYPWLNRFDLKFNQNFYFYIGEKKQNIQLGVDILNVGNMLCSTWGNAYYMRKSSILAASGYQAGATEAPVYQFQVNGTQKLTETFQRSNSTSSTWSMQINLRYIF